MVSKETLRQEFDFDVTDECLDLCMNLCAKYGLDETDLICKYESWQMESGSGEKDVLAMFKKFAETADFSVTVEENNGTFGSGIANLSAKPSAVEEDLASPKKESDIFLSQKRSSPNGTNEKYHSRDNSGKTECTLNENLQVALPTSDAMNRLRIKISVEKNGKPSKNFMYTKPDRRREALNDHLEEMSQAIASQIGSESIASMGVPSQVTQTYVGRVVCETEGKMNQSSIFLEGTLESSGGHRSRLNIRELPGYALFPGQVVGVQGMDSTGGRIVAQQVIQGSAAPSSTTSAKQLLAYSHDEKYLKGQPMSVMIACGPFTLSSDMDFGPFDDLMNEVFNEMPDALILMGPFVDTQHPMAKSDELDECYDQIFMEKIINKFEVNFKRMPQTFLVPSVRDAFHPHVLPQPEFDDAALTQLVQEGLGDVVTVVPNPCTIRLNEVTFGICSTDVLMHLSAEEVARDLPGAPADRMGRLASHLIQQRSFYPLHPPPAKAPVDMNRADCLNFKETPDVLVVPSDLKHFVKTVGDTVVVNPGRVAKGAAGGTYSKMAIYPVSKEEMEPLGDKPVSHKISTRARADIIRV